MVREILRALAALGALVAWGLVFVLAASAYEGFADGSGVNWVNVVYVTNLNNAGPGSLRTALAGGSRHIWFTVAGTINLASPLSIQSGTVLDGASAPWPGITLQGHGLIVAGVADVIIRNLRIWAPAIDGVQIRTWSNNIVVDAVSVIGPGDGAVDVTDDAFNVTIQHSLLCSYKVALLKYGGRRVTMDHNFLIGAQRSPQARVGDGVQTYPYWDTIADVRNNLIAYGDNPGVGTGVYYGGTANAVANAYVGMRASDSLDVVSGFVYAANNAQVFGTGDVNTRSTVGAPYGAPGVPLWDACSAGTNAWRYAGMLPRLDADNACIQIVRDLVRTLPRTGACTALQAEMLQ